MIGGIFHVLVHGCDNDRAVGHNCSTKVVGKIDRLVVEIVCAFVMVAALPDLLDGLESFCSSSSTRGKKDHSNWQGGGWQCSEG